MPSLSTRTRPASVTNRIHGSTTVPRYVRVLIVSPNMEVRRSLLRTLEALAFCDEHLPDGSYCDLIHRSQCDHRIPRVVVTTRTGEWELYFQAVTKGAFDVIRSPSYATDVVLAVIRALREEHQSVASRAALA